MDHLPTRLMDLPAPVGFLKKKEVVLREHSDLFDRLMANEENRATDRGDRRDLTQGAALGKRFGNSHSERKVGNSSFQNPGKTWIEFWGRPFGCKSCSPATPTSGIASKTRTQRKRASCVINTSLLMRPTIRPLTSASAALLPAAKPTFSGSASRRTPGKRALTASAVPSCEPLSTTHISTCKSLVRFTSRSSCSRQPRTNSRVFHVRTMSERSIMSPLPVTPSFAR
jgi:hypothetical protein